MQSRRTSLVCRFAALLVASTAALTRAADTTNPASPWDLVTAAAASGAATVTIPPGTYRVEPGMQLDSAKNLTIVADHVTFIYTRMVRGLSFEHCQNVTLQGLTVDWDPLPFTQGVVIADAPDNSWIDVKLDAGYPRELYSRIDVCDPATRTRKRGMPFLWGAKASWSGDGISRITRQGIGAIALPGDPVSLSGGSDNGPPHGVTIEHSNQMTLRDVTVYTAPSMGIIEGDGDGATHYQHVVIAPGPKPAGATADRLLSTAWDAMQTKTVKQGPLVEDCEVRDAGDDSWSVQSSDFVVLKADGRQAVIAFRDEYDEGPQPGNRLCASLDGPEATVVEAKRIDRESATLSDEITNQLTNARPWTYWRVSRRLALLTLDRDCPFKVGGSIYDPDRQCNGFIFRHNNFRSPGRGALIKGGDGIVEDNTFVNCHSAVTICPEIPDGAASGMPHLIIRNNHISGTGWFCPMDNSSQAGAVSISADRGIIRDVTIESNTFEDINGVNISVFGASGVIVKDNQFIKPLSAKPQSTGSEHGINQHSVIWLGKCDGISFSGNLVIDPGSFLKTAVSIGKDVEGVTGLPDGVATKP